MRRRKKGKNGILKRRISWIFSIHTSEGLPVLGGSRLWDWFWTWQCPPCKHQLPCPAQPMGRLWTCKVRTLHQFLTIKSSSVMHNLLLSCTKCPSRNSKHRHMASHTSQLATALFSSYNHCDIV